MDLQVRVLDCIRSLDFTYDSLLVTTLYVDDLTLAAKGEASMVIEFITDALNCVCQHLANDLKMEVPATKSVVIARLPSVAVAVANGVASNVVKPVAYTKLLGAGHSGGATRSMVQQKHRLKSFCEMKSAFYSVKAVGADVHQMACAIWARENNLLG